MREREVLRIYDETAVGKTHLAQLCHNIDLKACAALCEVGKGRAIHA